MDLLIPEVTIEECAEVIQAITKYIRFGPQKDGYDNAAHLAEEIGQLQYMLHDLELHWCLDPEVITSGYRNKAAALVQYALKSVCNQDLAGA